MNDVKTDTGQAVTRWQIDLSWFEQNGRSFSVLARECLCPKCYQKLKADSQTVASDKLLKAIRDCCSKAPDFIDVRMPALESVFRLLLAHGNKAMALEDILQELGDRCGAGLYRITGTTLQVLLNNDQYYGLSRVEEA
jgi:MarR-like DNA-binding transcriptional regulator SgrR of sgrS sRNA